MNLKEKPEPEPALKPSDRTRLAELEAEVRELRMENIFLKSRSRPQAVSATALVNFLQRWNMAQDSMAWTAVD